MTSPPPPESNEAPQADPPPPPPPSLESTPPPSGPELVPPPVRRGPAPMPLCDPWAGWALVAAGLLMLVGSVTPWATVNVSGISVNSSVNGTSGDGALTLACAVIIAAIGVLTGLRRGWLWTGFIAVIAAALAALISLIDVGNINGSYGPLKQDHVPDGAVSTGFGIWLVVAGAVLAIVAGVLGMLRRRQPAG